MVRLFSGFGTPVFFGVTPDFHSEDMASGSKKEEKRQQSDSEDNSFLLGRTDFEDASSSAITSESSLKARSLIYFSAVLRCPCVV